MITFRQATQNDAIQVAGLHAASWQQTYQGILSDDYLKHTVYEEKKTIWLKRLADNNKNLWVLLAEEQTNLCAFVCVYLNNDSRLGAFMDNLHVAPDLKGKGLGRLLMRSTFQHVHNINPLCGLYLWVFENNPAAVNFYLNLGGKIKQRQIQVAPGGGSVTALKIVWNDLSKDFLV